MNHVININLPCKIVKSEKKYNIHTVKPVYNDRPWDHKIVAVVDRWSLFRGHFCSKSPKWDLKMVVVIGR